MSRKERISFSESNDINRNLGNFSSYSDNFFVGNALRECYPSQKLAGGPQVLLNSDSKVFDRSTRQAATYSPEAYNEDEKNWKNGSGSFCDLYSQVSKRTVFNAIGNGVRTEDFSPVEAEHSKGTDTSFSRRRFKNDVYSQLQTSSGSRDAGSTGMRYRNKNDGESNSSDENVGLLQNINYPDSTSPAVTRMVHSLRAASMTPEELHCLSAKRQILMKANIRSRNTQENTWEDQAQVQRLYGHQKGNSETKEAAVRRDSSGRTQYVLLSKRRFAQKSDISHGTANFYHTTDFSSCGAHRSCSSGDFSVYSPQTDKDDMGRLSNFGERSSETGFVLRNSLHQAENRASQQLGDSQQTHGTTWLPDSQMTVVKTFAGKDTPVEGFREGPLVNLNLEARKLQLENRCLRQQLQAQSKPTKKMPKQDDGRFMAFVREQSRKESDLYEMLQEYMVENEALRAENSELLSSREILNKQQLMMYKENMRLMLRMEQLEKLVSELPNTWSSARTAEKNGAITDVFQHQDNWQLHT